MSVGKRYNAADDFPDEPDWEQDPEAPQACDLDDAEADEPELVPCPACGQEIYELAERCPQCGEWISPSARGSRPRSRLLLILAVVLIVLVLLWVL